ncbi:MAG TPA: 5-formyltetrahydrofolate cyclo-ligase [Mycobacterium sp.]|nr:5-formyltetrahydrofolate cyclo-ligase [Mycobacterium sp.]
MVTDGPVRKARLRERLLAARHAVPERVRDAEAAALRDHLDAVVTSGATVCAYVPVGGEPGSIEMLDRLRDRGVRVLLPVVDDGAPGTAPQPLMWGEYRAGELVPARFGLLEPARPWLPPSALAEADLVLVPALAVDRRGVRLGRGAGFYDRSLPLGGPGARLVAVVRDAELVDELPAEPHDLPVTHALTPQRGLIELCPAGGGMPSAD